MDKWTVVIETWPHSTGRGSEVDQMQAGPRSSEYIVEGETIQQALAVAEAVALGIRHNPIVWQTKVRSVVQGDGDKATYERGIAMPTLCPLDKPKAYVK